MMRVGVGVLALGIAGGCGRGPQDFLIPEGGDEGDSMAEVDPCAEDPEECSSTVTLQRAVDILFVLDNSGSMGDEQGTLAANFPQFVSVLEREQLGASYRVGVTTSDLEGLRATSCRQRLSDFIWDGCLTADQCHYNDATAVGCLDSCEFDEVPITPTEIVENGGAVPRSWIERGGGLTNLPEWMSVDQALQCIGPQGINGDGFEMPLESMRTVLTNESSGFLRDDALLAIIFVTDEADCSTSVNSRDALAGDAGRAFWSTPERASSGACWSAGVECVGGPGVYDDCFAVDRTWDASITDNPEDAVLFPVERYVDTLRDVARTKEQRGGNGTVLVAVIAGVPLDYPETGQLIYQDSDLPEFNTEYGIGPACNRGTEAIFSPPGIPPVRLREFAEAFATERRNIFSVCSPDYTVALEQIAEEIPKLGARACVPGCATDINPNVGGLQPSCDIIEQRPPEQGGNRIVPPCVVDNEEWYFPTPADTLCFRELTDPAQTTRWTHDDMSPQCVTRGANLEFVVERRDGIAVGPGVGVEIVCELDGPKGLTCEEL